MPFAGYQNFKACVAANRDKRNPEAYCGSIMHAVEDVKPRYEMNDHMQAYGRTHSDGKVEINPKKGDVVNTIIHEELHNADWDMPHNQVYANAKKIESQMSLPEQAGLLLRVHEQTQNPKKQREIQHTVASKVINSIIK